MAISKGKKLYDKINGLIAHEKTMDGLLGIRTRGHGR